MAFDVVEVVCGTNERIVLRRFSSERAAFVFMMQRKQEHPGMEFDIVSNSSCNGGV